MSIVYVLFKLHHEWDSTGYSVAVMRSSICNTSKLVRKYTQVSTYMQDIFNKFKFEKGSRDHNEK